MTRDMIIRTQRRNVSLIGSKRTLKDIISDYTSAGDDVTAIEVYAPYKGKYAVKNGIPTKEATV